MTAKIALFLVTKNEEKNLPKCLDSVKDLVSEIIVVDSESTDKTLEIAKTYGAEVYTHPFHDFVSQKNLALSKVTCPWALSLDADETLTPELTAEIKKALEAPLVSGYFLPRVNFFLGKQMKHSGLHREYILRLVRTDRARFTGGMVHEELEVKGKTALLQNGFLHYSYMSLDDYFSKLNKYTSLAAEHMRQQGKKFSLFYVLATAPFQFFKRYFLKLGFLDGVQGLIWAVLSNFYIFVKYIKLWDLQRQER